MSAFTSNVLAVLVTDLIGWGATISATTGATTAITGPTMRVVSAAPTDDDNLGSLALRNDAGNVNLYQKTGAGGSGWSTIGTPGGGSVPAGTQLLLADNVNPAWSIGATGALSMLTFDTRNGVEQVVVNAALGLGVSGGLTLTTGGITFSANLAQITLADNQATALQIGASGTLGIISVKTTNGAESVTFGGVGIVLPERTLDIPSAANPASNGVVAVALSVAINFPGGINTTSITLPTRTNGWLVRDAYVRSEGGTGGTATIQNTGGLDITNAMIPGNANAITRAAAINNVNASIASASALQVTTTAGTPAGMAFVTLQGL